MHIHTRTSSSRYGVQIRLFFQFLTFFPFVIKEADRVDVVLILSSGVWDPVDAERLSPSNRNAVPAPSRSYCLQEHTHGNGNASFKSSSSSSLVNGWKVPGKFKADSGELAPSNFKFNYAWRWILGFSLLERIVTLKERTSVLSSNVWHVYILWLVSSQTSLL
jgi:hypothetical protein